MKRILIWLIRFYQTQISPMHPPCCRFIPSCSAYALEAIQVHGALKGTALAVWRLIRCYPVHNGTYTYDPVPPKKTK